MIHLRLFYLLAGFVFVAWPPAEAWSQSPAAPADSTQLLLVRTIDRNEFIGVLLSEDAAQIVLRTESYGTVKIARQIIQTMTTTSSPQLVRGKLWYPSRYSSRYFAGPSGYGLKKGEGAYDNVLLLFNQLSYGFSDHFSLTAGLAPFALIDGPLPVWVMPKFSIPLKPNRVNLSIGALLGHLFFSYSSEDPSFAAVFSQITLGKPDENFSAGLGFLQSGTDAGSALIYSFGGTVRIGKSFALLTEGYFFKLDNERYNMGALGLQYMNRRLAIDAGVAFLTLEDDGPYPVPCLSLHVPFGFGKSARLAK